MPPMEITRLSPRARTIGVVAFRILLVGYFLFGTVKEGWTDYQEYVVHPPKAPIYGLYDVETFSRNGRDVPPLVTEAARWRRVIIQSPAAFAVRMMDDSVRRYNSEYNPAKNSVTVSTDQDKGKSAFTYSRPDAEHVLLEGTLVNDALVIKLKRMDPSKFLLVNRGFHWINERPFNR